MTTVTRHHRSPQYHQDQDDSPAPHLAIDAGTYDPDEAFASGSPPMKPLRPRLSPSESPPPEIPHSQVSRSPCSIAGCSKSNLHKIRHSSGDTVLINILGNGRDPDIARTAAAEELPADDNEDEEGEYEDNDTYRYDRPRDRNRQGTSSRDFGEGSPMHRGGETSGPKRQEAASSPPTVITASPNLLHLAAGALRVFATDPGSGTNPMLAHDISASTRQLSIRDDGPAPAPPGSAHRSSRSAAARNVSEEVAHNRQLPPIPKSAAEAGSGELPPLLGSPRSDSNLQSLPPLRSALADIQELNSELLSSSDKELPLRRGSSALFPASPPGSHALSHLFSGSHASPPISPQEGYRRNLPSPHSQTASSPSYYTPSSASHRPSADYSSSTTAETPSTDQSASTPATTTSVADRMSIDGITNPSNGSFVCTFAGCKAPAFQTQYLLNSHANVHSSARPHYCPVHGCPRGEGGKGFKRKNEMIRHGLVHESPGYVCPFCPDREHRYPRPDNLQRYVIVLPILSKGPLAISPLPTCQDSRVILPSPAATLPVLTKEIIGMCAFTISTKTRMIRSCVMSCPKGRMGRIGVAAGGVSSPLLSSTMPEFYGSSE